MEALLADAAGTLAGVALGTSTVTAYIESGTGVAAGGRTGVANLLVTVLLSEVTQTLADEPEGQELRATWTRRPTRTRC